MGQRKGQTGNPKGRPKGALGRLTTDVRQRIKTFVENEFDSVIEDFGTLEAKDRVAFFERFLSYVTPKLQALDAQEQIRIEYIELERLLKVAPDDAVSKIVDKVKELKEISKTVKK